MTALLIGAVWIHVGARLHMGETLQTVLAVVLAAMVTVGALEVPH